MICASFHFSVAPEDAISVILSNESHVVACASDGTPQNGELAKANTQVYVYRGSIPLTYGIEWTIDEYVSDGATFSRSNDVISLTSFDANSMGGYCDITIMLLPQQKYITKRFSVTRNIEMASPFSTGEAWNLSSVFVNGQYLNYEGVIYQWSFFESGNSSVNPKDDIKNNPTTTHWKSYQIWELLASRIILGEFGKLASAVFSGDYMYSQYGKTGTGVAKEAEGDYKSFDPNNLGAASNFIPNAFINFLTGAINCSNLHATGNSSFEGLLKAVSGSFKNLSCVNDNGDTVGGINFGSDGKMWFSGDMYHQGYNSQEGRGYRNYTSDLWCRGSFGSRQRNMMEVRGSYAYYYTKGTGNTGVYVDLTAKTDSSGRVYYEIPLYGTSLDYSGFPVDLLVIKTTGSYRYDIIGSVTKELIIINSNDDNNNIWTYKNGADWQIVGGKAEIWVNISGFMLPAPASNLLGLGWFMVGEFDNDW
ncbi:hypothetical protein [uncultured Bacteroides sp.]|uniref:hypothetical protein n=1 Tax=uncultured Bacteroides sp. TaxID=162156 RepID=UPI002AABBE15|nr:hypothetical protein [uncultured Bacteroides sp.]